MLAVDSPPLIAAPLIKPGIDAHVFLGQLREQINQIRREHPEFDSAPADLKAAYVGAFGQVVQALGLLPTKSPILERSTRTVSVCENDTLNHEFAQDRLRGNPLLSYRIPSLFEYAPSFFPSLSDGTERFFRGEVAKHKSTGNASSYCYFRYNRPLRNPVVFAAARNHLLRFFDQDAELHVNTILPRLIEIAKFGSHLFDDYLSCLMIEPMPAMSSLNRRTAGAYPNIHHCHTKQITYLLALSPTVVYDGPVYLNPLLRHIHVLSDRGKLVAEAEQALVEVCASSESGGSQKLEALCDAAKQFLEAIESPHLMYGTLPRKVGLPLDALYCFNYPQSPIRHLGAETGCHRGSFDLLDPRLVIHFTYGDQGSSYS